MIEEILSYVYSDENLISAKQKREKVRESMKEDSKRWKKTYYTHCGEINFIEYRSEVGNRELYHVIEDSDQEFR